MKNKKKSIQKKLFFQKNALKFMKQFSPSINKNFQTNFSGKNVQNFQKLKNYGKTSSRLDFLPKTGRRGHWPTLRKVWRPLRHLRFLCAAMHFGPDLRWMQLWKLSGEMRNLRWTWSQWRLLLQRMYYSRKRPRWMSKSKYFETYTLLAILCS